MESQRSFKANVEAFVNAADKAGRLKPDIICFTESVISNLVDLPLEEKCQPVPGEWTAMAAEKARLYNTYIILPMYESDGGIIYNSAVLIGRDGELKGKYRKMHIPLAEAEAGITPGDEYGIFYTDFGRIGIMICWDQAFPEVARILRLNGAEMIFLPTYGEEPLQQMARAKDNGVYVIVSGMYGPQSSRIINPLGEICGKVNSIEEAVCIKEIDLNEKFYTLWLSVGPCNGEPQSLYIKERRNDTYGKLL
jgi:predicted amidohydrolase